MPSSHSIRLCAHFFIVSGKQDIASIAYSWKRTWYRLAGRGCDLGGDSSLSELQVDDVGVGILDKEVGPPEELTPYTR